MKEYMLRILNRGDHQRDWTDKKHTEFVHKCEKYIGELQSAGQLVSAQPLRKQGMILSRKDGAWQTEPLDITVEIQVGYYIVRAESTAEAVKIAKRNPEFEYGSVARVEVRPITAEESSTGFVYPR